MIRAEGGTSDLKKGTGTGINLDAWGRQKTVSDFSLLHGMFTYEIPLAVWKEEWSDVEQIGTFTNATSVDGKLHLEAGATLNDRTALRSFRHPRYEPNRGHTYSVSAFFPDPTADGVRDFGLFTREAGFFFRLKSDGLYAVRRTTISSVTTDTETPITTGFTIDYAKGNIYDIQFQWRGVGNAKFFIGDPNTGTPKLVHTIEFLNTSEDLSVYNPALPIAFECENLGDNVVIESGCVDASTEGGSNYDGTYGAIATSSNTGSIAIGGGGSYNVPVLAVHSKELFSGLVNTRDVLNLALTAYSDQRCVVRVWITRDSTALNLGTQTWTDFRDANLEYVEYDPSAGTSLSFDTTKADLQFSSRVDQDLPLQSDAVFDKAASLNFTPGDYLIFTMHRENGGNTQVGVTYEFSEQI